MGAWVAKAGRPSKQAEYDAELPLPALEPIDAVEAAAKHVLDGLRCHARRIAHTPLSYKAIPIADMQKLNQALREALDLSEHIALLRRAAAAQIPTAELIARLNLTLPPEAHATH